MIAGDYSSNGCAKKTPQSELDASVERNLTNFTDNYRIKNDMPKNGVSNKINNFRVSHSMQNIYEIKNESSINTNNDFDQNSILQPENTQLLKDAGKIVVHQKVKSEVDLKDVIGSMWTDSVENMRPNTFGHIRNVYESSNDRLYETQSNLTDKSNNYRNSKNSNVKTSRNKSSNLISHLANSSKTLPKPAKFNMERMPVNKEKGVFVSTKNIDLSTSK